MSLFLSHVLWLVCLIYYGLFPHSSYIYSIDILLYPYALPLESYPSLLLKSLSKCNLSFKLRSLQSYSLLVNILSFKRESVVNDRLIFILFHILFLLSFCFYFYLNLGNSYNSNSLKLKSEQNLGLGYYFESFFSNIFIYLWNLLETIFSTILIFIKYFSFSSSSSTILTNYIFFFTVSFLNSFFLYFSFSLLFLFLL